MFSNLVPPRATFGCKSWTIPSSKAYGSLKLSKVDVTMSDLGQLLAVREDESTNRAWLVPALEELELRGVSMREPTKTGSDDSGDRDRSYLNLLYENICVHEMESIRGQVSLSRFSVEPTLYDVHRNVDVVLKWWVDG